MIILGTNSIKDTGFDVANSLKFENSNSEQLTRSIGGSPTNTKKGTFSYWIKRTKLSTNDVIVSNEVGSSSERAYISFNTSDYWRTVDENGIVLATNAVFRDVSAWTNFVLTLDSTLGTETDRVKLYINGTRYTDFQSSSYFNNGFPNQDIDFDLFTGGQTNKHHIGNIHGGSSYLDGYLAEVCYCDGQTLDASSFGEFSEDSPNIWMPKNVSGLTFGNNGYYLDFEDSSALGNDAAGSNNFTVSNITAIDQATDTCTNNFPTFNSLVKPSAAITLSEGNLKGVFPGSWTALPATFGLTKGKWYFEAKNETSGQNAFIGVVTENQDWDDSTPYNETTGVVLYGPGGRKSVDGTDTEGFFATLSSGQIVGVALDLDSSTKTIQFSVNGTDTPNSTPVDLPSTFDNVFIFPYFIGNSSSATSNWELNFGSPLYSISSGNSDGNGYGNFEYSVPSGFFSINTKNLAEYG